MANGKPPCPVFHIAAKLFKSERAIRSLEYINTNLIARHVDGKVNKIFGPGHPAAAYTYSEPCLPKRLNDLFGHFLGITKQHHGIIGKKQFVINAGIS